MKDLDLARRITVSMARGMGQDYWLVNNRDQYYYVPVPRSFAEIKLQQNTFAHLGIVIVNRYDPTGHVV